MTDARLSKTINPVKFAEKRLILKGLQSLANMLRLQALCFVSERLQGEAKVWLEDYIDEFGVKYLHGKIEAKLPLICQRCMKKMDYHLTSEFYLSPALKEEEGATSLSQYEPLYLTEQEVKLPDLIEDELILALPLVAKHKETDCPTKVDVAKDNQKTETTKPFANLAEKLKRK